MLSHIAFVRSTKRLGKLKSRTVSCSMFTAVSSGLVYWLLPYTPAKRHISKVEPRGFEPLTDVLREHRVLAGWSSSQDPGRAKQAESRKVESHATRQSANTRAVQ